MEDKRRDAGALQPANSAAGTESPLSEPPSARRRGGAQKRKANSLGPSSASSTPSKRLTREKAFVSQSPIHYGPLTRARQGPSNLSSVASAGTWNPDVQTQLRDGSGVAVAAAVDEFNKASEEWEALEATIEAEFEAIRSRDSSAHVVPNHCGWFSWTKIHLLEERTLTSFFDGKSETRTPDMYMEIRNWIMKKFHADPNTQIELKDLSELEVGNLDARKEVLEFLDHWGLINFHPFLSKDCDAVNAAADGAAKRDSLLENLYHFQGVQSYPPTVSRTNIATQTVTPGLLPMSAIAEELVGPEGPSVEYHCNSCSADCSRKRYHCQKQADFDLCCDCFTNGKFDSDMVSSDFILMEPAEAPGLSGGNWTDQETLLLLEALELYKENWNEIAEHVATKTKAQCILHFVQMPIEDTFFDSDNDIDDISKGTADPASTSNDASVPKDAPDVKESNAGTIEDEPVTSPLETSTPELVNQIKVGPETMKQDENEVKVCEETSKPDGSNEEKVAQDTVENFALKALHEAFETVGYCQTPEGPLSFAEVGNPVMALALFLGQLGGSDVTTATAHSSLKSISSNHSGLELATRHCFVLEDPPDERKEPKDCESVPEIVDQEARKDEIQGVENQKEDRSTSDLNDTCLSNDNINKKNEDSVPEDKRLVVSGNDESADNIHAAKEPDVTVTPDGAVPGNLDESKIPDVLMDCKQNIVKESGDLASEQDRPPGFTEEFRHQSIVAKPPELTEVPKDVDMVSDSLDSERNGPQQPITPLNSLGETSHHTEASKDVDMVSDPLPSEKNEAPVAVGLSSMAEPSQILEAPNAYMVSNNLHTAKSDPQEPINSNLIDVPENNDPQKPVTSNPIIENSAITGGTQIKEAKKDRHDSTEVKDDDNIVKLKRAAVSALSAATVKAKLLANEEEDQIRQLATMLIEKQLHKLETKLGFFNEVETVMVRVREQLERSRQRLYHERAQIIAARLGIPASSSRAMPPPSTTNRIAGNFANSVPRPPMSMSSLRPPLSRPMGPMAPSLPNPSVPTTWAGGSIRPSNQDKLSSVRMK